jgi:hypothetical protein
VTVALGASTAWAQNRGDLTGFVGYQFGGQVGLVNGDLKLADGVNYGGILDFTVRPGAQVELSYTRQESKLRFVPFVGTTQEIDMPIDFWQIGGVGYVDKGRTRPFGKITLGATHFMPQASSINDRPITDEWRFSMVLGLGVKVIPSERVGLRLGGNLYSTFLDSGSSIWCGGGAGCSFGLFGTGIFQADIQGGLTIFF